MPKKDKKKKDSTLLLKINKQEKDLFVELCEDLDTSASREIRRFIRQMLEENDLLESK